MRNTLLAILSGVLVMFSFPTVLIGWHAPNIGVIGWVALVPLFTALMNARPARAFLLTFIAGLVWFGGSLYWIFRAVHVYGGVNAPLAVAVTVLLVVVLAAYVAVAPALACWVGERWRVEMIVFMPVMWVAVEFVRSHVPMGGFSWSSIAMSQWHLLVPLQILDITGIYGLIFAMVWVNWCIAELIAAWGGAPIRFRGPKVFITAVMIAAIAGYGVVRLHRTSAFGTADAPIIVGIVQGNIAQEEKWDEARAWRNIGIYRRATTELAEAGVDLIIWPEASYEQRVSEKVESADPRALGLPSPMVGDLPAVMIGTVLDGPGDTAYNSALLFDAQGLLLGRYDKTHLVPFGEYVPYRTLLFFARKLTAPVGDFRPGTAPIPLSFSKGVIGPLICYEDIFPEISRELVLRGANVLVNITNDAWYGVSSAPYQHMALSVFRAVENRRPMVRSTNTGVSAFIEPTGEVRMTSGLFEHTLMVGAVTARAERTFYTEHGDWFAVACVMYAVLGLVIATIMRCKKASRMQPSS